MAAKYQLMTELYRRTGIAVAKNPQAWQSFLAAACRNYKCRFDEQLLIYTLRGYETIQEGLQIICMNRLLMAGIGILFVILSIWVLTSKRKGKINAANVYNRSFQYIQDKLSSGSKN